VIFCFDIAKFFFLATTIEDALELLSTGDKEADRHPERRAKAV